MSTVKKEEAAIGCSIIESDTKSSAAINLIISDNSKDCSDKQSDTRLLELNVHGDAGKMMLETWKDVATSRISDDDETLIKVENVYSQETHQSPPSKGPGCKIDFKAVVMGQMLTDLHINLAQSLLKRQFDKLNGLNNTLYQTKKVMWTEATVANKIQIIHCKERNNWIVATTVNCAPGIIKVYDSVFSLVDHETREVIYNLFQVGNTPPHVTMMKSQKQAGSMDCGVFSIA